MRTINLKLAAGETSTIAHPGKWIRILSGSADVFCETDGGDKVILAQGIGQELPAFDRIHLLSVGAQTIRINIGNEKTDDNRMSGTVDAEITSGSTLTDSADVSALAAAATTLAAANTDRKTIVIHNLIAGVETLRIGGTPLAATGIPLAPGATLILDTTAAVKAYNPGAAAQSVSILEIET